MKQMQSFSLGDGFRILTIGLLFLLGFALILGKLFFEQVQKGEVYRDKISRQSIRQIRIPAQRGKIFSSDLKVLADNSPNFNLVFYPNEIRSANRRKNLVSTIEENANYLAAVIGRPKPLTADDIRRHLNTRPGLPLEVFEELTPKELALALEASRDMVGVDFQSSENRIYPGRGTAAHLLGYVRAADPKSAPDKEGVFYYIPDLEGRAGLEKAFDRPDFGKPDNDFANLGTPDHPLGLRGLPGYSLVQVNHLGYIEQNLIEKIEPINGNHLILTINYRAQRYAEYLLYGQKAALVAVNANTGDVITAASAPSYDLSKFTPVLPFDYYSRLSNDPAKPLFNRALAGRYTPGSILKPLVALAMLNAGHSPEEMVVCDGGSDIGNAQIRCASWRHGGHGPVNLYSAIAKSCNDFFIEKGLETGAEKIFEVLGSANIGQKTGIELPESAGMLPSFAAKKRIYNENWNKFDTALLSIGQGITMISPLQAAVYCAALANGGTLYRPHLAKSIVDMHGNVLFDRKVEVTGKLATKPEYLDIVKKGMFEVVNSPTGSGKLAAQDDITIYGKTGSAEIGSKSNRALTTWFIAYAKIKGNTYAVAVMVEDGASGGRDCAPIAGKYLEELNKILSNVPEDREEED